jgi:aminocarboxymuconate-semialdehyde decarboxylase
MMYSCAPGSRGSAAVVKTKRRKSLRVDIHCHYLNPDAAAKVAPLNPAQHEAQIQFANALTREVNAKQMKERGPKLSDIELRLKVMDRMGIDIQAVSPSPN